MSYHNGTNGHGTHGKDDTKDDFGDISLGDISLGDTSEFMNPSAGLNKGDTYATHNEFNAVDVDDAFNDPRKHL